jgi:hypothetical protein
MRKFETALGAPQKPTGHVSALGPWSLGLMTSRCERTRRGKVFFWIGIGRKNNRESLNDGRLTQGIEETFPHSSDGLEVISSAGIEVNSLNFGR